MLPSGDGHKASLGENDREGPRRSSASVSSPHTSDESVSPASPGPATLAERRNHSDPAPPRGARWRKGNEADESLTGSSAAQSTVHSRTSSLSHAVLYSESVDFFAALHTSTPQPDHFSSPLAAGGGASAEAGSSSSLRERGTGSGGHALHPQRRRGESASKGEEEGMAAAPMRAPRTSRKQPGGPSGRSREGGSPTSSASSYRPPSQGGETRAPLFPAHARQRGDDHHQPQRHQRPDRMSRPGSDKDLPPPLRSSGGNRIGAEREGGSVKAHGSLTSGSAPRSKQRGGSGHRDYRHSYTQQRRQQPRRSDPYHDLLGEDQHHNAQASNPPNAAPQHAGDKGAVPPSGLPRLPLPSYRQEKGAVREGRRRRREESNRTGRTAEQTVDPWFYESIPLAFIMAYLKRQSFRSNLLREFILFAVLTVMFCVYAEFHPASIEKGFFASLGIRQQYGRQEFPTAGRQVDVFRQQEKNALDFWIHLDSYFHDVSTPLKYLDFVHDVLVGSGNPPAYLTDATQVFGRNGSTVHFEDVYRTPRWTSRSGLRAFTMHGGSPFLGEEEEEEEEEGDPTTTVRRRRHRPLYPHGGAYFCGALRMRTIRVRNGTGTIQRSLYRSFRSSSPGGDLFYVPEDTYAARHESAKEDTSQLCPRILHPFPDRVAGRDSSKGNETVLLYRYVPCDAIPYRAGLVKGAYGNYPCGGHLVDIPFTYPVVDAQRVVRAMSAPSCRFLDSQATRLALTEFFVYLPSTDQWLAVKFRTEVAAAGNFNNCIVIRVFRVHTDAAMWGQVVYSGVTLAVVTLYFAVLLYKTALLLRKDNLVPSRVLIHRSAHTGWRPIFTFLSTLWPYVDVAFVVSAYVSFGFYFRWVAVSRKELPTIRASLAGVAAATTTTTTTMGGGGYPEVLDEIQRLFEYSRVAATVGVVLLCIRAVYFCHFFAVTRVLMIDMVAASAPRIAGIAFGFSVATVGYAMAGYAVFGATAESFSTIGNAMATMLQLVTGDGFSVPSSIAERLTTADAQVNEHFVFLFFWSYYGWVACIASCLLLSLTSLTYQELTQKTYIISNDVNYFAREIKVWRKRLSCSSMKLIIGSVFGIHNPVRCHEELLACLRRTREEKEMQRIMTLVEAKMEQIRAESDAFPSQAPSHLDSSHYNLLRSYQKGKFGSVDGDHESHNGGLAAATAAAFSMATLLGSSGGKGAAEATSSAGTSTSAAANTLEVSLSALLCSGASKPKPGEASASTSVPSATAAPALDLGEGARGPSSVVEHGSSKERGAQSSERSASLQRLMEGKVTTDELRTLITADLMSKARAERAAGRCGASKVANHPGSDSDSDVDNYALLPDDKDTLNYFSLTDILPARLFNRCGGEPFFTMLWIDVVADYAEMLSTTAAMEKRDFMQAVADVTRATVGSQLTRVEQLDATLMQLEGHMASIIANVQAFSKAMADVSGAESSQREGGG